MALPTCDVSWPQEPELRLLRSLRGFSGSLVLLHVMCVAGQLLARGFEGDGVMG